ncbi:MAG: hypothetical protein MJ061_01135, partial [Mailhella sp.]|nr:hypothetical protein [Mailhella sp.]
SRICDSLMYTGISVALLEVIVRVWLLEDPCGCTVTEQPVFVFTVLNMVNALYICAHNIYRGFPKEACFGNLFRSALAIPMSSMYDRKFFYALIFARVADPSAYLVPAAAIVTKCASDTVACVIESVADRRNNYMLRKRDFSNRLRGLFDCYTRLELAFPDADILALLGRPKEFLKITSSTAEGTALQVESFINALDLMYFWYYQPCAQQTLMSRLRSMTQEERLVFSRFQSILHNVQEICQLFVDGMLGTNFSKALSFYLDNHDDYIGTITRLCEKIDKRKSR